MREKTKEMGMRRLESDEPSRMVSVRSFSVTLWIVMSLTLIVSSAAKTAFLSAQKIAGGQVVANITPVLVVRP